MRATRCIIVLATVATSVAIPARAVSATPTTIGACTGQVGLATFSPIVTDVTQFVTVKGKLLKDVTTKMTIAGDCSTAVRPGDPIHPAGGLVSPLTPKAMSLSLAGNFSCTIGSAAQGADPNA